VEMRLLKAMAFLRSKSVAGVKWAVPGERDSGFDILVERRLFLERSDLNDDSACVDVQLISLVPPPSLHFDVLLSQAKTSLKEGDFPLAYRCLVQATAIRQGAGGAQFVVDMFAKVCFEMGKFEEAEEKCRALIQRGYGADNWIRLGKILQATGRFHEALEAYQRGLDAIGLPDNALQRPVFPVTMHQECGAFVGMLGAAECLLELDDLVGAARFFRKAAKVKADSHRTLLGFGALFLKAGDLAQAWQALSLAAKKNEDDPKISHLLGCVCEAREELNSAFDYFKKAFGQDKAGEENLLDLCRIGLRLGQWPVLESALEEFLEHRPGSAAGLRRLAEVKAIRGREEEARACLDKAALMDNHAVFAEAKG